MLFFDLISLKTTQIKKNLQTTNPYITRFALLQNAVKVQKSVFVHRLHRCEKNPQNENHECLQPNLVLQVSFFLKSKAGSTFRSHFRTEKCV